MKFQLLTAALVAGAALPAQALQISDMSGIIAPTETATFDDFLGLVTSDNIAVSTSAALAGATEVELGAFDRDLSENGLWGAGKVFAATLAGSDLTFEFTGVTQAVGAFVNHYAEGEGTGSVTISAFNAVGGLLESYTVVVDTTFDSYNEGVFLGISRSSSDIARVTFSGAGIAVDDLTFTAPVPEPETYALMTLGLGLIGWLRRRQSGR